MTETIAELKFKLMQANTLIESRDEEVKALSLEVTQLRQALTEANALYNTVEAINLDLTERVEAMQADAKLSDMAWKDNQAALKAQAETIARLEAELAQCKHALDDDELSEAMCKCGHELGQHVHGECMAMLSYDYICDCDNFEVTL